ncbi:MAG: hypothetical protein BYD32DRAFT_460895 [Podila humilis]|nr:MAG: hypothetical protein BYD32DRAFT_460895 [Podila humilis]
MHAPSLSLSSSSSSSHFARILSVHQQPSDDTSSVPTAEETNNAIHNNSPSQQQPHCLSFKSRAQFFEKRTSLQHSSAHRRNGEFYDREPPTLDMLGSLQSAGEAARSRRSTRGGSRGGSPTISHDPNSVFTMSSTDLSPVHASLAQAQTHDEEIPKEEEKWATGWAKSQKLGFVAGGFSSSRKSRSNSNSSTSSLRRVAPGNGEQQQLQQQGEDACLDKDGSQPCLLRRSSTRDSDATSRSNSSRSSSLLRMTTTCSPSFPSMLLDQSDTPDLLDVPKASTHSHTASSSTDDSFNGNASGAYKEGPFTTSHSLEHLQYYPNDNSNKAIPTAHRRRKSLSILQHLTHSASQKFRTLMRTPSGLRRTVISHSMEGREREKEVEGGHREEESMMEEEGEKEAEKEGDEED